MDRTPPPMDLSCTICYHLGAVIIFFIAFVPFFNNALIAPPMANLSTNWSNNPSIYTDFSSVLEASSNIGSHLICGFDCPSTQQTQSSCLFGVRPVQITATLQLTGDGDLILHDSDGTFVWSTNISSKSVFGMKFTELGNLVLFDPNSETVWQSFDHPTDSLLVGQALFPGQKLISSTNASNWTPGLFSLTLQHHSLSGYVGSNPPLVYFEIYSNVNYVKFENESFIGQKIPVTSSSSAQFIRLDPNGHLKAYELAGQEWNEVADQLTSHGVSGSECGYPMSCGNYGICSSNGQCACPDDANSETSTFRQISYRQPNLGCSLATPISCDHSQYHTLLELNNASYFYINPYAYTSTNFYLDEKLALNDCKTSCLKNCSCKAALFLNRLGFNDSRQGCLLLSEVFSLINNERGGDDVTMFLKVQKSRRKSKQVMIILGSSLGALFGVFFVVAFCFFLFRNKGESEELDKFYIDQLPGMPTGFSYEELKVMTTNFDNKLGEGGFGSVFQGTLSDGTNVAVKRLNGFGQVKKSFLTEVETIGSTHHVNLVRLIRFCAEKSYRLLVYEYMSDGSLDTWIFQRHQDLTLGWQSRKKIIMDIAKGLTYLHEECRQKIFHLDIKPQNILLDECFNVKISDFGLSKLIDKDQSQVVTMMRGTPGYLAPEWLSSIITKKVDVYSFGVVVLEMLYHNVSSRVRVRVRRSFFMLGDSISDSFGDFEVLSRFQSSVIQSQIRPARKVSTIIYQDTVANNPSEFTKDTSSLDAFAQAIDSVSYASLVSLSLSLGRSSVFVAIYHWFEKHFGKMTNGSLCATRAMQHELAQNWGIKDMIKGIILATIIGPPIVAAIIVIVQLPDRELCMVEKLFIHYVVRSYLGLFEQVGTIIGLLALTGLVVFMLFFLAAIVNAIIISILVLDWILLDYVVGNKEKRGAREAFVDCKSYEHDCFPLAFHIVPPLCADSTVLAYVLSELNRRHNYGVNLFLLSVDEGITGYRDDSLETVKRNEVQYGLPLKVVSYKELYGWTMDEIVKIIRLKNNCTFCGVFRRQALDCGASLLKVDKLATGHNVDDIAETILLNILRGDIARKVEEERLLDIVDKYNDDMQTNRAKVVEMMRVAAWCLQSDFLRRPSMSAVVKVLEALVEVENNLDYSFTTPVVPRAITVAGHQVDGNGATTPLFASALSGPR
ncbi:hypothetical protein TEA_014547 [Camellia sinensis var. sinensis]|uniref:non-specific serine/threonine protein kinase n=1 Tax=Camellia sinensis var. sinensis TaxID=542762 RepID=A0A4S4EB17_CAMSN|nr:hypothetical protein TEA_014547 [Camellia sinensis var. sinensis]